MDRLLLKRTYHADGGDGHSLSLLSPQGRSVCEDYQNLLLPFSKTSCVRGSSCGGLLYFDNFRGKIIICNPTTRAMKLLDPPQMRHYSDAIINFECSGFGYDHKSDDYKVVRVFDYLYHYCTVKMKNPCRYCRGGGKTEMKVEVFSLKTDSWKQIKVAADFDLDGISSSSECYVNGSCYWIKLNHRDDTLFHYSVLSFDFTRECFSTNISLPPIHKDNEHLLDCDILVKVHDDMVGVIRYERASQSFGVVTTFRLLVLKESSWIPWVCVDLCDVERPLMLHQGRFLFLKKKNSEGMGQLVVYDLETKKLDDLDIYDNINSMMIFSYEESRFSLPDSKPMDGSYSKEEEEREDLEDRRRLHKVGRMFRSDFMYEFEIQNQIRSRSRSRRGDYDYEIQNQSRSRRRSRRGDYDYEIQNQVRSRSSRGYQIQNQWMDSTAG